MDTTIIHYSSATLKVPNALRKSSQTKKVSCVETSTGSMQKSRGTINPRTVVSDPSSTQAAARGAGAAGLAQPKREPGLSSGAAGTPRGSPNRRGSGGGAAGKGVTRCGTAQRRHLVRLQGILLWGSVAARVKPQYYSFSEVSSLCLTDSRLCLQE